MAHQVVVIGAGYAGVIAASRLAGSREGRRGALAVTLVNPTERFVERIRLHEYVAGSRGDATIPLRELLHPGIRLVIAHATEIDPRARTVSLSTGDDLPYDHLIYAVGSGARSAPAAAHTVADAAGAERLRRALDAARPGDHVAVVGGGLTAIETATEIAESRPALQVELHAATLGPSLGERGRAHVRATLDRLGVTLDEGVSVDPAELERLGADHVVWCAGLAVPALAASSGLLTDADGRMLVTPTLHSLSDDRILGAGDAVRIDDTRYDYLRMACATAMPLGGHVADTVLRALRGRAPRPHSNGFAAQCVSLGRKDAVVQFVRLDDRPTRLVWRRGLGAWAKETICRFTVGAARSEARRSGSYIWLRRRFAQTAVTGQPVTTR